MSVSLSRLLHNFETFFPNCGLNAYLYCSNEISGRVYEKNLETFLGLNRWPRESRNVLSNRYQVVSDSHSE